MIPRFAIAIVLTALLPTITNAQQRNAYYPFDSKADYYAKLHVLRGFIQRYGRTHVNRIYVAKADSGDGSSFLYGYWPEGHSILLLGHFNPTFEGQRKTTDYSWLEYKTRTDLRTDVVPTVEDIGGSSYLVDRPWTRRIIKACIAGGRKVIIDRRSHR
ncbi:MAG TPA: hypothetical protein VNS63_18435 [Blastocatellia bacterium]|nr:hypothetical protein [Blastocatellia bacterium]